jgi:hypothetical protein
MTKIKTFKNLRKIKLKKKKPSEIVNVNINLFNVNVDSTRFRINFYNKDNFPFEKINTENIILKQKG